MQRCFGQNLRCSSRILIVHLLHSYSIVLIHTILELSVHMLVQSGVQRIRGQDRKQLLKVELLPDWHRWINAWCSKNERDRDYR